MDKLAQKQQSFHQDHIIINVLVFDGMNLLDLAGPVQAFTSAYLNKQRLYNHRYLSIDGRPVTACCGLKIYADGQTDIGTETGDLLIPGGNGIDACLGNEKLLKFISNWRAQSEKSRIISVCSGALLLAKAGLLANREATTHWGRENQVCSSFPEVNWDLDKIFIGDGKVYTSAGVTTGIDLALSIIGSDWGAKTALNVAQELVVYFKRNGGQSQFSNYLNSQYQVRGAGNKLLENLITSINLNPEKEWKLDTMAEFTRLNSRTLSRKFQMHLSTSPIEFVEQVRLDRARQLLADKMVLKQVARQSGFGDVQRMRRAFKRRLGVTLQDYVRNFA